MSKNLSNSTNRQIVMRSGMLMAECMTTSRGTLGSLSLDHLWIFDSHRKSEREKELGQTVIVFIVLV